MYGLGDRIVNILNSQDSDLNDEKLEELRQSLNVSDQQYTEKMIKRKTNKVIKLKREIRKQEKEIESLIKLRQ
ncbi:MAG: hypothetical protein WC542_07935 [Paludibacter sp.]